MCDPGTPERKSAAPLPNRPADDGAWFEIEVLGLLPDLYATAMRFTKEPADAEDLVAESITKAWAQIGALSDRSRFRGWIFRILTTTFLSDCRARRRRPAQEPLPDEGAEFSLFERLHQPFLLWWGNPEQEFLNTVLREDLERAVDALPEAFRVVVVLSDVRGFSYQEIADALNVPIGTVRSRLARGRSLLQKALWEHAADAGLVSPTSNPDRRPTP